MELIKLDLANKINVTNVSNEIIKQVKDGNVSALDAITKLKFYEQLVKKSLDGVMETAILEREKFSKSEKIVKNGYELSIRESGVGYSYENCQDPEWNEINETFLKVKKLKEEREKFLKSLTKPTNIVTDEGEAVTIYPPAKKSTTSLVCS